MVESRFCTEKSGDQECIKTQIHSSYEPQIPRSCQASMEEAVCGWVTSTSSIVTDLPSTPSTSSFCPYFHRPTSYRCPGSMPTYIALLRIHDLHHCGIVRVHQSYDRDPMSRPGRDDSSFNVGGCGASHLCCRELLSVVDESAIKLRTSDRMGHCQIWRKRQE